MEKDADAGVAGVDEPEARVLCRGVRDPIVLLRSAICVVCGCVCVCASVRWTVFTAPHLPPALPPLPLNPIYTGSFAHSPALTQTKTRSTEFASLTKTSPPGPTAALVGSMSPLSARLHLRTKAPVVQWSSCT